MSSVVYLNSSNATSQPNVFQYNFPAGSVNFTGRQIAITSIILPYSWYNVTSGYNNQNLSIIMPRTDGSATTTLNLTIPQGFYTVQQLNSYLQSQMQANGFYLMNGTSNVYYLEIVPNLNLDAAQINCYVVPNTLPGGYTNPGGWVLPSTGTRVPQIVISSTNNFGSLIGMTAGTYPSTSTQAATYSITSNTTANISPVSSVLVNCNLVNNQLSVPSNIITNIPITAQFASQIIYQPYEYIWLPILDGSYPYFRITFLDQLSNQLGITDTNIIITCLIK